jgi:hypothetical protein
MSKSGSSIVLKRPKQWICIDLISRTSEEPAPVVAANVITVGRNGSTVVDDVLA